MSVPSASAARLVWPSAVPIAGVSWCGGRGGRGDRVPSTEYRVTASPQSSVLFTQSSHDPLDLSPVYQIVSRGERAEPAGTFAAPLGVNPHPIQFLLTQLAV